MRVRVSRSPAEASQARRSARASGEPGVGTGTGTMEEDDSYGQCGLRPGRGTAPSLASSPLGRAPGGGPGGSRFPGTVLRGESPGRGRAGVAGRLRGARVSRAGPRGRTAGVAGVVVSGSPG